MDIMLLVFSLGTGTTGENKEFAIHNKKMDISKKSYLNHWTMLFELVRFGVF